MDMLAAIDWSHVFTVENAIALVTLTVLEIVLGIDNIVFIAVLCGRLPVLQQDKARKVGLALALVTRVLLLTTLTAILGAAEVGVFTIDAVKETFHNKTTGEMHTGPMEITWRDIIMLVGGGFLIFKATKEIHHKMEDADSEQVAKKGSAFWPIIGQILIIDVVFSLDSVITAVGMAQALWVMVTAVIISVMIMLMASGPISRYVEKHPTMKMLALSFLILIGVVLVADGLGQHISKGYVYFAMAFSFAVEMLNLRMHRKKQERLAADGT
jgi:predicted tellurium resistance membrane protein TerC